MDRAIYRIIDANFNRAREAARVVEEFCRFALDCAPLAGRAKQLRHELSAAIGPLNNSRLIAGRDTTGDVGCDIEVAGQLKRADMQDCFSAGCKRLTEALRVLAETTQTIDADTAKRFEQLRYTCYTLEKDIVIFAVPAEKFKSVRLYVLISGYNIDDISSLAKDCIAGGADCLQLRVKNFSDKQYLAAAKKVVRICKDAGAVSIINDRVD
ncbi:MAG: thiamine phosphate synthase, partial [Planctomycetes bacterium]|nr:thiamine phosphate synthase [Planctomycetota bacterium]